MVELVEWLVNLVNETWERRGELEPDTTVHQPLQPLELYPLLPETSCRACGENTCFNFALKLTTGQVPLKHCPPLYEPDLEGQRAQLEELLATKHPLQWEGGRLRLWGGFSKRTKRGGSHVGGSFR